MMSNDTVFQILENDTRIGELSRQMGVGYVFSYDPQYVAGGGHELCVTMPVDNVSYLYEDLPPFFTNCMAEGWLLGVQKSQVSQAFSEQASQSAVVQRFGVSCFGALQIIPEDNCRDFSCVADELVSTAQGEYCLLTQKIGQDGEAAMIPGAQPKVLVVETEKPGVFRLSEKGDESTHIAKIPHEKGRFRGVLENEFIVTKLTEHLLPGDDVCDVSLGQIEGLDADVLLIKRFDRTEDGKRLPFYEFNQLLGKTVDEKYTGAYAEMADYIYDHVGRTEDNAIKCDIKDVRKLFRRILVDILVGNTDSHFKNYALKKEGDVFSLTPNYDKVSSALFGERKTGGFDSLFAEQKEVFDTMALAIAGKSNARVADIDCKRIVQFAHEFQLTEDELLEDLGNLKKRVETIEPLFEEYQKYSPKRVKELKTYLFKRWNGCMEGVGHLLKGNKKPKNIFATKTNRRDAEARLAAQFERNPQRPDREVSETLPKGVIPTG